MKERKDRQAENRLSEYNVGKSVTNKRKQPLNRQNNALKFAHGGDFTFQNCAAK